MTDMNRTEKLFSYLLKCKNQFIFDSAYARAQKVKNCILPLTFDKCVFITTSLLLMDFDRVT